MLNGYPADEQAQSCGNVLGGLASHEHYDEERARQRAERDKYEAKERAERRANIEAQQRATALAAALQACGSPSDSGEVLKAAKAFLGFLTATAEG